MNRTVQDLVRPDVTAEQNAALCPRCGGRETWATFDGITFCRVCRFWYAGYGPYRPPVKWRIRWTTERGQERIEYARTGVELLRAWEHAERANASTIEARKWPNAGGHRQVPAKGDA
jgi:hypothetical protein